MDMEKILCDDPEALTLWHHLEEQMTTVNHYHALTRTGALRRRLAPHDAGRQTARDGAILLQMAVQVRELASLRAFTRAMFRNSWAQTRCESGEECRALARENLELMDRWARELADLLREEHRRSERVEQLERAEEPQ